MWDWWKSGLQMIKRGCFESMQSLAEMWVILSDPMNFSSTYIYGKQLGIAAILNPLTQNVEVLDLEADDFSDTNRNVFRAIQKSSPHWKN